MELKFRGLDLLHPEATTDEELREFHDWYDRSLGQQLIGYDFWMANRPDAAKRRLLTIRMADSDRSYEYPVRNVLAGLHYYTIIAYEEGIRYEIRHARSFGATKAHVMDTFAVAYIHAHVRGTASIVHAASKYLDEWQDDDESKSCFPPDWQFDRNAFDSGLDFSKPTLSADELSRLVSWYKRNVGEVPLYVNFLAEYRPSLLKAHRSRYENAIQEALPKQMLPYLMLYFNIIRGFRAGIREAVLLGKHFGMTRDDVVDAMCRASTSYGGPDSLSIAMDAVGDVLASWNATEQRAE